MDYENRVIRMDSFSKVFSPGIRMGFVSGPKYIVNTIQLEQQVSSMHASGTSQLLISQVLKQWGNSGFEKHIEKVQNFYKNQRDSFIKSCNTHLTGLAEWNIPKAGMFGWIKLKGIEDSEKLILEKGIEEKIIMVPGKYFLPMKQNSPYVRASYSLASEEKMDIALKRLANLLKKICK